MPVSFKLGVVLHRDAPAIAHILERFASLPFDVHITSGNDRTHKPDSKHYTNQAVDVRNYTIPKSRWESRRHELERALNREPRPPVSFSVLIEPDHFHVQVSKGFTWPSSST